MIIFTDNGNTQVDSKAYKNLAIQLCEKVTAKIPENYIELRVEVYPDTRSQLYQNYQAGKTSKEEMQVELLSSFLDDPIRFEGKLVVATNDKTVIQVESGNIVCDDLDVIAEMVTEKAGTCYKEVGKDLLKYVHTVVAVFGTRDGDDWVSYTGPDYIYREKDGQIKVIAQEDKREVLNNDGFTQAVTIQDITELLTLRHVIEQFKQERPNPPASRFKL